MSRLWCVSLPLLSLLVSARWRWPDIDPDWLDVYWTSFAGLTFPTEQGALVLLFTTKSSERLRSIKQTAMRILCYPARKRAPLELECSCRRHCSPRWLHFISCSAESTGLRLIVPNLIVEGAVCQCKAGCACAVRHEEMKHSSGLQSSWHLVYLQLTGLR